MAGEEKLVGAEEEEEEEEEELCISSESEIGEALDFLDSINDGEGGIVESSFTPPQQLLASAHFQLIASGLHPWRKVQCWDVKLLSVGVFVIWLLVRLRQLRKRIVPLLSRQLTLEPIWFYSRCLFNDINGCISTGKEANVYHATESDGQELAIKIYKTSDLVFKNRDRYVQGDYRFRHGYCKHKPRKMVKTWAEKEMRNLMRLKAAGIRCPTPLLFATSFLVMEFIGKAGWAAPRL